MSEISTRIWLDERLRDAVTNLAIREGTTVRELLPRLLSHVLAASPDAAMLRDAAAGAGDGFALGPDLEPGPPTVILSESYRCHECGAQIRLAGLSAHLNKHTLERQASEAERSQ